MARASYGSDTTIWPAWLHPELVPQTLEQGLARTTAQVVLGGRSLKLSAPGNVDAWQQVEPSDVGCNDCPPFLVGQHFEILKYCQSISKVHT